MVTSVCICHSIALKGVPCRWVSDRSKTWGNEPIVLRALAGFGQLFCAARSQACTEVGNSAELWLSEPATAEVLMQLHGML